MAGRRRTTRRTNANPNAFLETPEFKNELYTGLNNVEVQNPIDNPYSVKYERKGQIGLAEYNGANTFYNENAKENILNYVDNPFYYNFKYNIPEAPKPNQEPKKDVQQGERPIDAFDFENIEYSDEEKRQLAQNAFAPGEGKQFLNAFAPKTNADIARSKATNEARLDNYATQQLGYQQYLDQMNEKHRPFVEYNKEIEKIDAMDDKTIYAFLDDINKRYYDTQDENERRNIINSAKIALKSRIVSPEGNPEEILNYERWSYNNPSQIDENRVNARANEIEGQMNRDDELRRIEEQKAREPKTWQELRDQLYGSEADRLKESKRKAMVGAIGDSLRHIGNLVNTGRGATPQQFNTTPATEEVANYKQGKAERDAASYQMWAQKQKEKQLELENNWKMGEYLMKQEKHNSDMILNDTKTKQMLQQMGVTELKLPYELELLAGNAVYAQAHGEYEKYQAIIKELEASNKPEEIRLANLLKKATIDKTNAQRKQAEAYTAKAYSDAAANQIRASAYAAAQYASAAKSNRSGDGGTNFILSDNSKITVPKANVKACNNEIGSGLADYIMKNPKKYGVNTETGAVSKVNQDRAYKDFIRTKEYDVIVNRYSGTDFKL